jgi:ribosome-associated protein
MALPTKQARDTAALADRIARVAADRKATDIRVLDLRGIVAYTDFFVVCSGNTERQAKAIHDAIHYQLKHDDGLLPSRTEGEREARWILLDYLDCVVHIFTPEARQYYRLEQLWGEAPARAVGRAAGHAALDSPESGP